MVNGAHVIFYSKNPDADRSFLRTVLELTHVDAEHGWLIFGLPPSELAVHPTEGAEKHELYFICDDIEAFVQDMKVQSLGCSPVADRGWGLLTCEA